MSHFSLKEYVESLDIVNYVEANKAREVLLFMYSGKSWRWFQFGDLAIEESTAKCAIRYAYKSANIKFANSVFWLFRLNVTTPKFPAVRYIHM